MASVPRSQRMKQRGILGAVVLAALAYGLWMVTTRPAAQVNDNTNADQATAAQQYTEAYNQVFRSSTVSNRTLVDAAWFSPALTSALQALPLKSGQQDEIARKLAELNSDGKRLAFVVTYSVPSGALPDDAAVEASTLSDEQDRSYSLLTSQRIYSGTTTPAQVTPLLQHSYLLVYNTPGEGVTSEELTLVIPAGDATPRTLSWDLASASR